MARNCPVFSGLPVCLMPQGSLPCPFPFIGRPTISRSVVKSPGDSAKRPCFFVWPPSSKRPAHGENEDRSWIIKIDVVVSDWEESIRKQGGKYESHRHPHSLPHREGPPDEGPQGHRSHGEGLSEQNNL